MEKELIKCGQVISVKKERLKEYLYLHENIPQDVHKALTDAGYVKMEIFVRQLPDGEFYLFNYSERIPGSSDTPLEQDCYLKWMDVTGECQKPLPQESLWADMKSVFEL